MLVALDAWVEVAQCARPAPHSRRRAHRRATTRPAWTRTSSSRGSWCREVATTSPTASCAPAAGRTGPASRSPPPSTRAVSRWSSARSPSAPSTSPTSARRGDPSRQRQRTRDRGRLRRPHRPHQRQPRLGGVPDQDDRRRGPPRPRHARPRRAHGSGGRPMTDPRIRASIRYPNDLTVPGMWHARLVRSPYAAGPRDRRRHLPRPRGCARPHALGGRAAGPLRLPDLGPARARRGRPARRRPGRRRGRRRRGHRPRGRQPRRGRLRGAPGGLRRASTPSAPAPRGCTTPTPSPTATPPTSACGRWTAPTCATASGSAPRAWRRGSRTPPTRSPTTTPRGFDAAQVIVDETFRMPAVPARRRWNRTPASPAGATAGSRSPPGPRRRSTCARTWPACSACPTPTCASSARRWAESFGAKTFVRTEAIAAAVARRLDRPVRLALDRDEEFVTLTRHAATVRVRLGATRDGRFVAKRVWCWVNTGAYADCGPGVAHEDGLRRRRPLPVRPRRRRLLLHLHQPSAGWRLPRLRRHPVGVGIRARHRPDGRRARRSTRSSCAAGTCSSTATPSARARPCTTSISRSSSTTPPEPSTGSQAVTTAARASR